jgi:hypothetical protein
MKTHIINVERVLRQQPFHQQEASAMYNQTDYLRLELPLDLDILDTI